MDFVLEVPTPRVERIVDDHALIEHRMVIRVVGRQPERDCVQARRFRCQIMPGCIGATHDQRQFLESRILKIVMLQEGVEAT